MKTAIETDGVRQGPELDEVEHDEIRREPGFAMQWYEDVRTQGLVCQS